MLGIVLGIYLLPRGKDLFVEKRLVYVKPEPPTEVDVMREIVTQFSDMGAQGIWRALQVAKCESGFNHLAVNWNTNKTRDGGVYQLNSRGVGFGLADATIFNYKENIRIAHEYVKKHGWGAWVCNRSL